MTRWVHLHEEAHDERLPDVDVVVTTRELGAGPAQVEPVHDPRKLLSYIVSALHRPVVDEVVVAPLRVFLIC